jgi:D-alanyl-D-alanine carboxypeptidase
VKHQNIIGIGLVVVAIIIGIIWSDHRMQNKPASSSKPASQQKGSTDTKASQPAAFDKKQYSLDDPNSIWVIANKQRPLQPKTYAPADLVVPNVPLRTASSNGEMHVRQANARAMETMFAAAKAQGINLMLASGYRSYMLQVSVYSAEVKNYGQAVADSESARPGYSEHQTGLAADIEPASHQCEVTDCFANLPEGKWLAANEWQYGYVIRYRQGTQNIAGYKYEPWHVRYVGTALAAEIHKSGQPLETFFGLPVAPSY